MISRIRRLVDEREAGFTLIELLVVIIIIGILAAIAIPTYLNQRNNGYDAQAKSDINQVAKLQESNLADFDQYANTIALTGIPSATLVVYKKSASTVPGSMATFWTTTLGVKSTSVADKANGHCEEVQSKSGKWFSYNSIKGGVQATGVRC